MYKGLLFIVLLSVSLCIVRGIPSDEKLRDSFKNWKNSYKITFDTAEEEENRFQIWKTNMIEIVNENSKNNYNPGLIIVTPDLNMLKSGRDLESVQMVSTPQASSSSISLSANHMTHFTEAEKASMFTGFDPSLTAAVSAAALSTGAIIGIACGGAAFVAGSAAGGVIAYKKYQAKKKLSNTPVEMEEKPATNSSRGMDMFKFDPSKSHQSITARAYQ
ncbi:hypothetical protein DLAC_09165 [Tieghemostelium lacteum]|uniref:Cathepsin propeptide inhibitor domain-containing protein n=1 Tax=Tieghemostelium lacteum TaxID=361077 RepID=A0A151Z9A5_TIELA|nr:hypothetical protein DLAC_09165 [Tieghemostelium lacteum]|eukprot:KYQ90540.1 hypothetical protein DLAC_09165 [Tieghemostelium lacteum]